MDYYLPEQGRGTAVLLRVFSLLLQCCHCSVVISFSAPFSNAVNSTLHIPKGAGPPAAPGRPLGRIVQTCPISQFFCLSCPIIRQQRDGHYLRASFSFTLLLFRFSLNALAVSRISGKVRKREALVLLSDKESPFLLCPRDLWVCLSSLRHASADTVCSCISLLYFSLCCYNKARLFPLHYALVLFFKFKIFFNFIPPWYLEWRMWPELSMFGAVLLRLVLRDP